MHGDDSNRDSRKAYVQNSRKAHDEISLGGDCFGSCGQNYKRVLIGPCKKLDPPKLRIRSTAVLTVIRPRTFECAN